MKSYLDALHTMQGQGASVVRDNATSAAKLGVEVGLAIDGGLAGTSGVPKGTATAGEVAGAGSRNPLLDDAIPRNGDRLVVNQGSVPTCGHNSCGMVLDTLGKEVDISVLVQKVKPSTGGIYAQDVADLMRSEGVPASAFGNRNVADLTRYTSSGTPVVVRIADRTGGSDFSHFVVVDGVTTRNGVAVVAIRDPHGAQYFSL
ncbi:C39 family peptidase [Pseudomonas nitroreducens]|uniref:C39 family peptidase n=1 Tax=Pseudomonas nitroreducens TaxID=46680 RepID=UPI0009DDE27A